MRRSKFWRHRRTTSRRAIRCYQTCVLRFAGAMSRPSWSTTTTVFIFLSPQFLINHPEARDVFIECSHRTTLRAIALDEGHIHIQHGTLFRSKIRALQVLFFAKIFREQSPMMRPRLIVLAATMPTSYLSHLCRLLSRRRIIPSRQLGTCLAFPSGMVHD